MTQELKLRIVTAFILLILVILLIFGMSNLWFDLTLAALVLLAAWEWTTLAQVSKPAHKILFLLVTVVGLLSALYFEYWVYIGIAWWLGALLWLPYFPRRTKKIFSDIKVNLVVGLLILIPTWQALHFMRDDRLAIVLLLLLIWSADIGAYFSGRHFGKNKLAVNISPGKTLEGAAGGALLALMVGCGFLFFKGNLYAVSIILILLTVFLSIVGDLVESAYKREADLKDSGNILPGHGGILDRIDSLTAATPGFYLMYSWYAL